MENDGPYEQEQLELSVTRSLITGYEREVI